MLSRRDLCGWVINLIVIAKFSIWRDSRVQVCKFLCFGFLKVMLSSVVHKDLRLWVEVVFVTTKSKFKVIILLIEAQCRWSIGSLHQLVMVVQLLRRILVCWTFVALKLQWLLDYSDFYPVFFLNYHRPTRVDQVFNHVETFEQLLFTVKLFHVFFKNCLEMLESQAKFSIFFWFDLVISAQSLLMLLRLLQLAEVMRISCLNKVAPCRYQWLGSLEIDLLYRWCLHDCKSWRTHRA